MKKWIDLRSDTVTQPTKEMREAMLYAEVGDDVYGDDPTISRLEARMAELLGKEAAMFVASGTMGNQVSIMTHTHHGDEVILGAKSHIVHHEAGAAAKLSGIGYALVDHPDCFIYSEDVKRLTRPENDLHSPPTTLLCLENALCDGNVVPVEIMQKTASTARGLGLAIHLDGARIFNAALALGVSAKEIADCADSVSVCISKGLCSPVGALVCGSADFINKARRNRKIMGGGMRQAGFLAACGLISLDTMRLRLYEDHENARYMGECLAKLPDVQVELDKIKINMVFCKMKNPKFNSDDFVAHMLKKDIKVYGLLGDSYRFVTHHDVMREDIDKVVETIEEYILTLPKMPLCGITK